MDERTQPSEVETALREKLLREGKTTEEIDAAVNDLRARLSAGGSFFTGRRFEYRSSATLFGVPWVHVVLGRDPQTGRVGKAVGIIAIARIAFGVLPIGQLAVGLVPVGQLAVGAIFALGQAAFAGYDAVGQLAVASHFALGQMAAAGSAIGQFAVGRFVIAQAGWGRHVWSSQIKDPQALDHFKEMFAWLLD